MQRGSRLNIIMQVGLVAFTMLGFLLTSLKLPQYGLAANLISEFFWFYAGWKAWRAQQYGILITTSVITLILLYGVLNYWVF